MWTLHAIHERFELARYLQTKFPLAVTGDALAIAIGDPWSEL